MFTWIIARTYSGLLYVGQRADMPGYLAGFVCDDFGNLILRYEWKQQ